MSNTMFCYVLQHDPISQEVLGVSWGTNTHCLTTLSLTCVPPVSLSEARTWAWPSLVCPIVCFMQEGKSDVIVRNRGKTEQEVHLVQTMTARASTKHNEATNIYIKHPTKTQYLAAVTVSTQNDETRHSHTSTTAGTTQHSTLSTTSDDNRHTTTSLKGCKIINIHDLLSWILCQQLLSANQNPQETFMTPSDKLFHIIHWVKNEGHLTHYLKTSHYTEASWTLQHPLSLPWIPRLFLYTLPHAVVWKRASPVLQD